MPSIPPLLLVLVLAWGFLGRLFDGGTDAPAAADAALTAAALAAVVRASDTHPGTAALYATRRAAPVWTSAEARQALADVLADARHDGIETVGASAAARALAEIARAEARWTALDRDARDTLADPRPAALARTDVLLSDGALRLADALAGRRADPRVLYPGVWFPAPRDTSGAGARAVAHAVARGDAAGTAAALDALRPRHAGYHRLRARLAALDADLAPIPDGPPLAPGERSVRVPHVRARLAAMGFFGADTLGAGWQRRDPFLFSDSLASALGRFELAQQLPLNRVLEPADAARLNAPPDSLRRLLALNLERWRWMPDSFGETYLWANLPAFELRAYGPDSTGRTGERLRMAANIGNALTTGWTTPVITDSVHTVEFQPAWYVPASLAASTVFPLARADSLALHRQGFEVTHNGRPVDSRLVRWDSVGVAGFRFVQRPGPANPLGRVKFMMTNPYAILIHDTNRRHTLAGGRGAALSSGCIQAGDPAALAEFLLTTLNGWTPGEATRAWRGGPRRGVGLERPMRTHFVYFTAVADDDGALRTHPDPYGYDARLARALGLDPPPPVVPGSLPPAPAGA